MTAAPPSPASGPEISAVPPLRGDWRRYAVCWFLAVAGAALASRWTIHPLSVRETLAFGTVSLGLCLVVISLRWTIAPDRGGWRGICEYLRLLALPVAAGWLFAPFLTSNFVGGLDARWYGYVMVDALQQARAGALPVFVGQGEFVYNGAIHPYRTAPYYTNLGIALDFATWRTLAPLAIQHLVVLTTGTLAGLTTYTCLALLLGRRWLAWMLALIYVSGPAVALYIYGGEMYMTFASLAWMPLVLYGNIRLIQRDEPADWVVLAAGLALVWHCHAPVGAWATMCTVALQGLRLLTRDCNAGSWARAAAGTTLFAGLAAYYFVSLAGSLIGRPPQDDHFLIYAACLGLGVVSVVRLVASGGRRHWWAGCALALAGLAFVRPPHAVCLALLLGGACLLRWADRCAPALAWRRRWPELLGGGLLAAGLLAAWWVPEKNSARLYIHQEAVSYVLKQFPDTFLPISPDATILGDLQPGYSALGLLGLALAAALVFPEAWALRALVLVGTPLVAMLLPLPRITPLLYSFVPDPVYRFSSVGLWLRFFPLLINLATFAGGLAAVAWIGKKAGWLRTALVYGLVAVALCWNYSEVQKPIERGFRAVNSPHDTAAFYRSENAALYIYCYDQLPHPHYLTSGIVDYHLESRLLSRPGLALLPDPLLQVTGGHEFTVKMRPNPANPTVYELEPGLVVPPGERLLLHFDFLRKNLEGYLDMVGPFTGIRRIYYLPGGGFYDKGFGVAPGLPKVLAFWNTGAAPLNLQWSFAGTPDPAVTAGSDDFARLRVQAFRPQDLQVKTLGLIPYRAQVTLAAPAYLETPRVFIPGYRAKVNGRPVEVTASPDYLAMIPLEPGANDVEMSFRPPAIQWLALGISASAWLGLASVLAWRLRRYFFRPTAAGVAIPPAGVSAS
jgi:hypothetical protein